MDRYEWKLLDDYSASWSHEKRTEKEIRDFLISDLQKNLKTMRTEISEVSADAFAEMLGFSKPTVLKYEKRGKDYTSMSYKDYLVVCSYIEHEFKKFLSERNKKCIRICELVMPEIVAVTKRLIKNESILLRDYEFVMNYTPCKRFFDTFEYERKINPAILGKKYPHLPVIITNAAGKNDNNDLRKMISIAKKIENAQKTKRNIFINTETIQSICSHIIMNMKDSNKIYDYNKSIKAISQEIENEELKEVDLRERFLLDESNIDLKNGYIEISNISEFETPIILSKSHILLKMISILNEHGLHNNPLSLIHELENRRISYYYNEGNLKKSKPWEVILMYCKDTKGMEEIKRATEHDREMCEIIYIEKGFSYIEDLAFVDKNEKKEMLEEIKSYIDNVVKIYDMSTYFQESISDLLKKFIRY